MTDAFDVAVIGAGPAGSVAARELARRGKRVVLFDKATFPRRKVCGCCLNGNALSALATIGLGDLPLRLGAVPLDRVRVSAGREVELRIPTGAAVSREAFDAALVAEAVRAGVTFRPATTATIGTHAPATVVADGLTSRTTDSDVEPHSRIGAGTVLPDAPPFLPRGTIYMAAGRRGYVGLVRLEDDRLDVAAALDAEFVKQSGGLAESCSSILAETRWPELPLAAADWKGTPHLTRKPRQVAGNGWFAVGDAAGYVEPFTGEGMAWAIASGASVARFVDGPSHAWEREHARLIRSRQRACRLVAAGLRSPTLTRLAVRVLSFAPSLATPVVRSLNRPSPLRGVPQ